MASASALEVKKAAGEDVEIAAVRLGPVGLGEVVMTGAGALPFHGIFHAAIMGQDLQPDADAAAGAVKRALLMVGDRHWKRLLIHSFRGLNQRASAGVIRSVAASLVEGLLEGSTLQQVTFLAADEGERSTLHETLLRTIQGQG